MRRFCLSLLGIVAAFAAEADAPRILSTEPALPPRTVRLEELWRVGGADSDLLFGTVIEAISGEAGEVYVLDHQLCHVNVFSPEGDLVRTISREGDGPGEVRLPRDVVALGDGSIGIPVLFPGKLIRLTPAGKPLPTILLGDQSDGSGGFDVTYSCESRGGTLLVSGQHSTPSEVGQDRIVYLDILAQDGSQIARLCSARVVLDFQSAHLVERELLQSFMWANAVGPDGRVYCAPSRDDYRIEIYRPDGTPVRVIERRFENRKRTGRETRRMEAFFDAATAQIPFEVTGEIEPMEPVITGLFVDARNRLWVKHSRGGDDLPTGVLQKYDLFDDEGRYLQEVLVACEGDPLYDELEFLDDGRVLIIKGYVLTQLAGYEFGTIDWGDEEETSAMEVICCRMVE